MDKDKLKGVIIERSAYFTGKRCIGLDSGALASIMYYEEDFKEYTDILSKALFNFTHEECVGGKEIKIEDSEVFRVLTRKKYNLSKTDAEEMIRSFLKRYKIEVISKRTADKNLVVFLYNEGRKKGIEVHPPDVWIIADFKSCGVNLVYSNNEHFRKLCSIMGMSAPYFPTDEKQLIDKRFFELFKKGKGKRKN